MSSVSCNSDPWLSGNTDPSASLEFEDKFLGKSFRPLDDSDAYFASLEKKLALLKSSRKNQEKKIATELEATWKSYMFGLINGESREKLNINQDLDLERRVTPSLVHTWICPEQALTVGELAELLKHDSVASNVQNEP